jgi:peptidoglycan/xylan/chitin deacetylase (PgdA/CDA1 family)
MREVVAFVDGVGELPQKPMVITFDDGHYNNLLYALPIAKKYGFKIVISPVTIFSKKCVDNNDVKNPNYSHLSFAAMSEAVESGLVEFGNHTHNMHRIKGRYGISQMSTETDAEYRAALSTDVQMAQAIIEQATHIRPTTFAYPFGKYNSTARGVLVDLGFRAMLTCNEHVNKVFAGNTESLYALGRFNRDADFSTDEVMGKLTREPKVYKLK